MKKKSIWLIVAIFLIICISFLYSDYKKHQRYETYISSQIMQSLGSVVNTISHGNKTSDQALTSILESKSISLEQLNHINSVLNFYIQEIKAARNIASHLEMEHNEQLHSYISSSLQKLYKYERQLEKDNSKIELNSSELNFFKKMKDMTLEWKAVTTDYTNKQEAELYDVNERYWISLYNDLSKVTQKNLN